MADNYFFSFDCCVCLGKIFLKLSDIFDDRYGYPGQFSLAKCNACSHVALMPRLRNDELPGLYQNYYPRPAVKSEQVLAQADVVKKRFSRFIRWINGVDNQAQYLIKPKQSFLDIGCGTGLSLLEAAHLGGISYGIEADPNIERLAKDLDLKIHIGSIFDHPYPDVKFDLIAMNQVIEHLPDPRQVLLEIHKRLSSKGRLAVSFPNRDSLWCRLSGLKWINWHAPYHLQHFNKSGFSQMAAECGFRIVKIATKTPTIWTVLQLRALFQSPKLGVPSNLWIDDSRSKIDFGVIHDQKSSGAKDLFRRLVKRIIIYPSLLLIIIIFNRFADLIGCGDSILVELERAN